MLELLLCSLLTIFPDYLYRRYVQGKRLGKEITLYSVWFELRWGIVACLMLTVGLITVIFYNHPSTTNVTLFFRTVPIVPEDDRPRRRGPCRLQRSGRPGSADLQAGQLEAGGGGGDRAPQDRRGRGRAGGGAGRYPGGRRQDPGGEGRLPAGPGRTRDQAGAVSAQPRHRCAPGHREARGRCASGRRARSRPPPPRSRPPRRGSPAFSRPKRPAPRPRWRRPKWICDKTVIRAGVSGRVEQFGLRVGDIVNPMMRPAGILIPEGAGRRSLQAGFAQIEAQVMKVGMAAEVTCVSKPWTVIPMVVTEVQDFIAAGQFRGGEQLIDAQQVTRPGTILVFLEPLYEGGLDGVTPGSSCIANAYTSNHELIAAGRHRHDAARGSSRGGRRRARPRPDLADPGAGAADQDPGVQRTLTRSASVAASRAPETRSRQHVPQDRQPKHRDCRHSTEPSPCRSSSPAPAIDAGIFAAIRSTESVAELFSTGFSVG